jgi:tetratricopeptide (TPR) repeat protein
MRKFTYGLPIALLGAAVAVVHPHKAVASIPPEVSAIAFGGRFAIARSAVPEAIASNEPNDVQAYYNWGVARYLSGDKQGAIDDFNHAIQIDPNFALAYNNRGLARNDLGDQRGAIDDFNHALKIDPNNAYAYFNRGLAYYKLGDQQGAIADFQKAANLFQQQGKQDYYQRSLENIRKIQSFRHRTDRFVG